MCVFGATWYACSVIFSELVLSSSASVEGVRNISPIKTSKNNDRVKYGFSIVFYCSQSAHTWRPDVYKTWMACPSYFITVRVHATTRCIQNLNGLSIVFYRSQSTHTQRPDVYATTDKCGAHSGLPHLEVYSFEGFSNWYKNDGMVNNYSNSCS